MKKTILIFACLAMASMCGIAQAVTDFDGNVYDTVVIGGQTWMKENLKTTHYRNGVVIPHVPGNSSWAGITSGARCYYDNDSATYDPVYGALYNWWAVNNSNGICPAGWHVPTDAEWTEVEVFLGGSMIAGGKMKEAGTLHWLAPNTGATNSTGFTGLPGGMLNTNFVFSTLYENGLWWTSTWQSPGGAWSRYFWYLFAGVDRNPTPKSIGLSIRCIKDTPVGLGEPEPHGIKIFPNPARDLIQVEMKGNSAMELKIFNGTGEVVLEKILTENNREIDVRHLPSGIYIVSLSSDAGTVRQALLKE
jgi:uncharacterized protein (TIGR02145 family)